MTAARPVEQLQALTSIRGLAAWWVVMFHFREALPPGTPGVVSNVAAHGYLAVDLFFALSGFVIALNYSARLAPCSLAAFGDFMLLRLARLYPLHLFMLMLFLANPLAIALFSHAAGPGRRYDLWYYVLSLLLVQNWGWTSALAWNIPAWSISTEWFAYLLFPAIVWGLRRLAGDAGRACLGMALLLSALGVGSHLMGGSLGADIPHFGLARCAIEFTAGSCLHRLRTLRPAPDRRASDACTVLAMLCFAAFACLDVPDYTVMPAGFLLLIFALTDRTSLVARLLRPRVFQALGLVSYSTYLAHYFVKDWVKFLLVPGRIGGPLPLVCYLLATALASVALYRWVEMPGRRVLRQVSGRWLPGQPAHTGGGRQQQARRVAEGG